MYGDQDLGIPSDQVEQLRAALAGSSRPAEIVRYPDAQHGFHCNDRPAVYDAAAAQDGWSRTLAFVGQQLA